MSSYKVERVSLATALERKEIVRRGTTVADVNVRELGTTDNASLHFGDGDGIPLKQGDTFECCPNEIDGLYVTSTGAQAGKTLVLFISYGGGVRRVAG